MNRLKEIENIFNINNTDSVKQYKLHYTLYYMLNLGKLVDLIKHRKFLFSWGNVPGKDSEKLKRYLKYDYDIGWTKSAEIRKSDDGKTIFISVADKIPAKIIIDENREKEPLKLSDENREKATLKISDGRTRSLYVKKENGKVNIYKRLTNYKIKITFNWIYDLILLEISIMNVFLIGHKIYMMCT